MKGYGLRPPLLKSNIEFGFVMHFGYSFFDVSEVESRRINLSPVLFSITFLIILLLLAFLPSPAVYIRFLLLEGLFAMFGV